MCVCVYIYIYIYMAMDIKYTNCVNFFQYMQIYNHYCMPETNIILHANYISMKILK